MAITKCETRVTDRYGNLIEIVPSGTEVSIRGPVAGCRVWSTDRGLVAMDALDAPQPLGWGYPKLTDFDPGWNAVRPGGWADPRR